MLEPSSTLFRISAYFYTYFCKIDISTNSLTHLETIFTLFDISKTHSRCENFSWLFQLLGVCYAWARKLHPMRTTHKWLSMKTPTSPSNNPWLRHSSKIFTKVSKFLLTFTPWSSMLWLYLIYENPKYGGCGIDLPSGKFIVTTSGGWQPLLFQSPEDALALYNEENPAWRWLSWSLAETLWPPQ